MSKIDGGITDYKTEKEHNADIEELGLRFQYGCYMDKLPQSCFSLGLWYDNYKEIPEKAMEVFQMTCEKYKHNESCLKYANGLFDGRGLKRDQIAAFNVFKRNCLENNHDRSCFAAGMFLAHGISSHKADFEEAFGFFDKGCRLEFPSACFQAGLMKMMQPKKDLAAMAYYWTRACDLGHYRGCVNLAMMHKKGDHFEKSEEKCRQILEKAERSLKEKSPSVHGEFGSIG